MPCSNFNLLEHIVNDSLPQFIETEEQLLDVMTQPSEALIKFISQVESPLVILGAGGKMGPTLSVLARRAAVAADHPLDVIAVSRFSDKQARAWLEAHNVQTLSADLFDPDALETLPDSKNVIYLVGLKFGTQDNPSLTWAANTLIPAYVMERYKGARIVALSTGNVYPLASVESGGSKEADPLTPVGEYANSCVGRERIFSYFAQRDATRTALIRLSYAIDLRYGVLVDIAQKIYNEVPIDVTTGYLPYIWQGDANDRIIRSLSLAQVPARPLNLTGPQPLRVRDVANQLGELMGHDVTIIGQESDTAYLSDTTELRHTLGDTTVSLSTMIRWIAYWVANDQTLWNKHTHFEIRDGSY